MAFARDVSERRRGTSVRRSESCGAAPGRDLPEVHHVVTTAEEVHGIAHGREHLLEASLGGVLTEEDGVVDRRQGLEHGRPTLREGGADHVFRGIPAVLRHAGRAVLEVLVAEGHRDLEVRAADHLEGAVRVDREVPHAERRVVHVLRRHLAEAVRGDRLHEVVGVAEGEGEARGARQVGLWRCLLQSPAQVRRRFSILAFPPSRAKARARRWGYACINKLQA